MPLHLIATPIGNSKDISLRAIETLREADVVIGEERKEVSTLLKFHGIEGKQLELLNEHSKDEDVQDLLALCKTMKVALVSDCGTPGFCDPGARLVAACRAKGLISSPIPGASSLMCLLSMSGQPMQQFLFRGFLPVDKEERRNAIQDLGREQRPVVLMDTPYRLGRLLSELAQLWPDRRALIGCNFTQPNEIVLEGTVSELEKRFTEQKLEFILALFPLSRKAAAATSRADAGRGSQARRKTSAAGHGSPTFRLPPSIGAATGPSSGRSPKVSGSKRRR